MKVVVTGNKGKLSAVAQVGKHSVPIDIPESAGGEDTGPEPHDFIAIALASCTVITLKMYSKHKNWPLEDVVSEVEQEKRDGGILLKRLVKITGPLDEAQRARLLDVANKCPVHKMLSGKIEIQTELASN